MNLPELPPLDEDDKNISEEKTESEEEMRYEELLMNDEEVKSEEKTESKEEEVKEGSGLALPSLLDLEEDENIEAGELNTSEQEISENYEKDDFEYSETQEDFDYEEENEGLDYEEENEESFSFLPNVSIEDDIEEDEEFSDILPNNLKEDTSDNKKNSIKKKEESKAGFKELDDEAVKAFFANLKGKIFKEKKNSSKEKKEPKKEKVNKSKKEKIPKRKVLNKKIFSYGVTLLIVISLVFLGYNLIFNSFKPLNEISMLDKDLEVSLENFNYEEGKLLIDFTNEKDMSNEFYIQGSMKIKNSGLFSIEEISCKSDIIFLESGQTIEEKLNCPDFKENLNYKIDLDLVEIK